MIADKLLNGCEYSSKHFEIFPILYFHHFENLPQCLVHSNPQVPTYKTYRTLLIVQIVLHLKYIHFAMYVCNALYTTLQNCDDF